LFKKDNIYYAWLKKYSVKEIFRRPKKSAVQVSLQGPKGMVLFNGNTFDIKTSTSSIMQRPDEMLTFTNMNAKQCATKDEHGGDIITLTFKILDQMDKNVSSVAKKPTVQDILKDVGRITIASCLLTFYYYLLVYYYYLRYC
jgi:hypothetical protein